MSTTGQELNVTSTNDIRPWSYASSR